VARHARLIEYNMHEGCNARVFAQIQVESDVKIDKGTMLVTKTPGMDVSISKETFIEELLPTGLDVFETMHPVNLYKDHNTLSFYTWGGNMPIIRKGAAQAWLNGKFSNLAAGDILIFEEVKGVQTGLKEDANPNRRHAVRLKKAVSSEDTVGGKNGKPLPITEIEWFEADALPFDLRIETQVGKSSVTEISVACGNIILADHGRTIRDESLPLVPMTGKYRPRLERVGLTYSVLYDHNFAKQLSAQETLDQSPRAAASAVRLTEKNIQEEWAAQTDFFNSDRFTRGFVVEMENDRKTYLRFGSGKQGKLPAPGTGFTAIYRIGNGSGGNIGRDAIAHAVTPKKGITLIRNPLSARGGVDPEKMEQVRLQAPRALLSQERCVTSADYVQKIESHPQVQKAAADMRWTGSWHTAFIAVDRIGDNPSDTEFCEQLRAFIENFRITGADVRIEPPRFAPLDIAMRFSVLTGFYPSTVEHALNEKFSNEEFPNGRRGFLHPDNFTFGQPVYLSHLLTEAKKIPGVNEIEFTKFQRWGQSPGDELLNGKIDVGSLEIVRLDNNIDAPGNGRVLFLNA